MLTRSQHRAQHASSAPPAFPSLPAEIWEQIITYHTPSEEDYAVNLPWKRSARASTLVSLTQVSRVTRRIALPLVWAVVYVETMKDWGLLWKRCQQGGQYIRTFVNFWAIARLPYLCMDNLQKHGKDLLWYAFVDRKNTPLCNRKYKKRLSDTNERYDIYAKLGNGPDGYGPDAIVQSREMFLQACKDISSTWTRRLQTIHWDASTTLPEEVISNIRRIQETDANDETSHFPGLEHLSVDYVEQQYEERYDSEFGSTFEHARLKTYFAEPIWKLGPTTLKKLKFLSLAPPFWASMSPSNGPHKKSPNRLCWTEEGMLAKKLREYRRDTGPGQYYQILQHIQPEIFFSSSRSPFHCKELLPRWARLRCILLFGSVLLSDDEDTCDLNLPRHAEIFHTPKVPFCEDMTHAGYLMLEDSESAQYLRGAIQLRVVLERLREAKGDRELTGEDITTYACSTVGIGGPDATIRMIWKEDWSYACNVEKPFFRIEYQKNPYKGTNDLSPIYKKWLQDPQLAEEVAQAFNEGDREDAKVPYPFCHDSKYPGQVYFETSVCKSNKGRVWLDRPKHRGSYSNINVEHIKAKNRRRSKKFPSGASTGELRTKYGLPYSPFDWYTLHPHLKKIPSYLPSL